MTPEIVAGSPAPKPGAGAPSFHVNSCRCCELAWTWPVPTEAQLDLAYNADYYTSTQAKFSPLIEAWTRYNGRKRAAILVAKHNSDEPVLDILDIGCGRGVLLSGFLELGHTVLGIERQGSGFAANEHVETIPLRELVESGQQFHIVVLWHVLEHMNNPRDTLEEIHKLLTANGSLFIEVPNYASIQSRLFGSHWFHLDVPRHLFHFTPNSLRAMLEAAQFKVKKSSSFSIDQNLYGFLQSALNCLPLLPHNHLYSVLKSQLTIKSILSLILYTPIVAVLSVPAMLDLLLSSWSSTGAVISLQIGKSAHD